MMHHPFHVHNTQFKVLERNGKPPLSWELGLKDTVTVHKDETVKILLPTGPYSSSSDAYMYHCHILEHEDAGMMGQFIVV
jgi:bilirubin oxidase